MCSVNVIDNVLVFLGEGGLQDEVPHFPAVHSNWLSKTVKTLDFFKWEQENMVKFLKGTREQSENFEGNTFCRIFYIFKQV